MTSNRPKINDSDPFDQRHHDQAQALLTQREHLYATARQRHPQRWSGSTRNWHLDDAVYLNPERPNVIEAKAA